MKHASLFRSEEMSLIQLYIPSEVALPTVAELGELGLIHFRDLNPEVNPFQRNYVSEIRKVDEMDRKIRFLMNQAELIGIPLKPALDTGSYSLSRTQQGIDDLDEKLTEAESRILQMNSSAATLNKRFLELSELQHVLKEASVFFEEAQGHQSELLPEANAEETGAPLLLQDVEAGEPESGAGRSSRLGFVSGVIARRKLSPFQRIVWRALRGNFFLSTAEINEMVVDPVSGQSEEKCVFMIFAHGKEVLKKVRKIAESMSATLYQVDEDLDKRRQASLEVATKIQDLNNVLMNTNQTRKTEVLRVAEFLNTWKITLKKERAIYQTMNNFNFDSSRQTLIAEGWCPTPDIPAIQMAFRTVTERSGSQIPPILSEIPTSKEPPTFHRVNKFTTAFQDIVDAYGMASYQEVNPALYTLISFPFLFGVMFGDFGHGIIITCYAGFLIWKEKSLEKTTLNEMVQTTFSGRYIIFLMGLFSMYCGLIYNDVFAKAFEVIPSTWNLSASPPTSSGPYAFGIDPGWHGSSNVLLFTNSYKMKMSIIFGVIQMSFGIVLSVYNHMHHKKKVGIWGEFIPQMLFLQCIFGYLVFAIIYKWCTDYSTGAYGPPPSLLNMLIFMFLSPGTVTEHLYNGQAAVQLILILIAVLCIPWMLLAKPLYLKKEHEKKVSQGYAPAARRPSTDNTGEVTPMIAPGQNPAEQMHTEPEFDFGDIMVNQIIHTIEFCLGAVSNTASYLRLWALSLAHGELSKVLWGQLLQACFNLPGIPGSVIGWFIGFSVWFFLTVGILCILEGLSAFLHALRLHWVEFNNKFYHGTGYKFIPFSFERILKGEEEE